MPAVVDRMIAVPDAASVAAMRWCADKLDRMVGGSTGTNMWGAVQLIAELLAEGVQGSVVSLICDEGQRYARTYYDDAWVAARGWQPEPYRRQLEEFLSTGSDLNISHGTSADLGAQPSTSPAQSPTAQRSSASPVVCSTSIRAGPVAPRSTVRTARTASVMPISPSSAHHVVTPAITTTATPAAAIKIR